MIVFNYHFPLLSHIRHGKLVNFPYFLVENLRHMAAAVKASSHPKSYITIHRLINLIVTDVVQHQGRIWDFFLVKA